MKTEKEPLAVGGLATTAAANKSQWIAENIKTGEIYAGLILGLDGQPDYHLVLLPGEAEKVTWKDARDFASKIGGELPTRREQALLYANLKHEFKPNWYWSGEQRAAYDDYAWSQNFNDGHQYGGNKSAELRARAVRRLIIQ